MDFMNRAQQPRASVPNGSHVAAPGAAGPSLSGKKKVDEKPTPRWFRWTTVTLLFSVAILVAALTAYIGFRGNDQESKFVNKNELQAVFVNVNGTSGGQVYFGNIQELTSNYIRLTNVFYIQNQSSTSSTQNQSYTLVKLGCELHGPEDEMVINRDQVFFWENLKSSGQVSQKVSDYYKQNPNGQNCSQSSASSSTTQSSATTQSSTNSSSSTSSKQ